MKKNYIAPIANMVEIERNDVIATSLFSIKESKQEGIGTSTGWGDGQERA